MNRGRLDSFAPKTGSARRETRLRSLRSSPRRFGWTQHAAGTGSIRLRPPPGDSPRPPRWSRSAFPVIARRAPHGFLCEWVEPRYVHE